MGLSRNYPLVTAIVPIFYKETDLARLTKWMEEVSKHHLPIEVILIQDGDLSFRHPGIEDLVKIPIKYPVRLYRVDKHSAGGARNVGLENATGEWITFWDSDDYVRPREIVEILNSVTSNSTVVVSEFDVEDYESALKSRQSKTRDLVDLVETLGWWRLAFRRSRIGDMRVSELNMGEDQVFVAGLLLDENEIYYSHKLAYTYVINRKNQITGNRRYHKDLLASLIQMKEILKVDKHSHLYVLGLFLRLGITGLIRMKGKDRRKISRIVVTYLIQEGHLFRRDFYRIVARLVTGHLRKVV